MASAWAPKHWENLHDQEYARVDMLKEQLDALCRTSCVRELPVKAGSAALSGETGVFRLFLVRAPGRVDFLAIASTSDGCIHFGCRLGCSAETCSAAISSADRLRELIKETMSDREFRHTAAVEEQCRILVERMRVDCEPATLAGSIVVACLRGNNETVAEARVKSIPPISLLAKGDATKCPRCGTFRAAIGEEQTRRADEGVTVVLRCEACGFSKPIG